MDMGLIRRVLQFHKRLSYTRRSHFEITTVSHNFIQLIGQIIKNMSLDGVIPLVTRVKIHYEPRGQPGSPF
uniref:Uncharacterized protein n=1 Tax=Rhizophora mucronata TaxID=61149 RepID=A0A2P2QD75_RHIMU